MEVCVAKSFVQTLYRVQKCEEWRIYIKQTRLQIWETAKSYHMSVWLLKKLKKINVWASISCEKNTKLD